MQSKSEKKTKCNRLLTLPTTFTDEFPVRVAALNQEFRDAGAKVFELYGSFQSGLFHSARPAKYLPAITKKDFTRHVHLAMAQGISFNYLLNAPTYANLEYTHEGRRHLEELLTFLQDAGVASVTVAAPYLVDIITSRFPGLEAVVSTIGYVGTRRGINQFEHIGAGRIVLDVEANRDFRFLCRVLPSCTSALEIVVNPVCLYQCHFKFNHYCTAAFGAQIHAGGSGHPYNQYYLNWCFLEKLKCPGEFLRSPWVRPEDLHYYEAIGLHHFKIAGRGLPDDELLCRARAYLSGVFDGDLLAMLGWPHWLQFRRTVAGKLLGPLAIHLDNDLLDGFFSCFPDKQPDCRLGCDGCGHCDRWAARCIKVNDRHLLREYIATMEANIRALVNTIPGAEQSRRDQERWNRAASDMGPME